MKIQWWSICLCLSFLLLKRGRCQDAHCQRPCGRCPTPCRDWMCMSDDQFTYMQEGLNNASAIRDDALQQLQTQKSGLDKEKKRADQAEATLKATEENNKKAEKKRDEEHQAAAAAQTELKKVQVELKKIQKHVKEQDDDGEDDNDNLELGQYHSRPVHDLTSMNWLDKMVAFHPDWCTTKESPLFPSPDGNLAHSDVANQFIIDARIDCGQAGLYPPPDVILEGKCSKSKRWCHHRGYNNRLDLCQDLTPFIKFAARSPAWIQKYEPECYRLFNAGKVIPEHTLTVLAEKRSARFHKAEAEILEQRVEKRALELAGLEVEDSKRRHPKDELAWRAAKGRVQRRIHFRNSNTGEMHARYHPDSCDVAFRPGFWHWFIDPFVTCEQVGLKPGPVEKVCHNFTDKSRMRYCESSSDPTAPVCEALGEVTIQVGAHRTIALLDPGSWPSFIYGWPYYPKRDYLSVAFYNLLDSAGQQARQPHDPWQMADNERNNTYHPDRCPVYYRPDPAWLNANTYRVLKGSVSCEEAGMQPAGVKGQCHDWKSFPDDPTILCHSATRICKNWDQITVAVGNSRDLISESPECMKLWGFTN